MMIPFTLQILLGSLFVTLVFIVMCAIKSKEEPFEQLVYHAHVPRHLPENIKEGKDYFVQNAYSALNIRTHFTPVLLYAKQDIRLCDKIIMIKNNAFMYDRSRHLKIMFADVSCQDFFCRHLADLLLPALKNEFGFEKITSTCSSGQYFTIEQIIDMPETIVWVGLINEHAQYSKNKSIRALDYMRLLSENNVRKLFLRIPYARRTHVLFKDLISPNNAVSVQQDVENFALHVFAFDQLVYVEPHKNALSVNQNLQKFFRATSWDPRSDEAALNYYRFLGYKVLDGSPHTPEIENFSQEQEESSQSTPIVFQVTIPLHTTSVYAQNKHIPVFYAEWPLSRLGVRMKRGDMIHLMRQTDPSENGIYKVFESMKKDRLIYIAQVHYIAFDAKYARIETVSLDRKDYRITLSKKHPYFQRNKDLIQRGDVCFLSNPFDFYGYVEDIDQSKENIRLHIYDDEYVFRNDYECVGDSLKSSKQSCESRFDLDRKRNERVQTVWDRRCASNRDCPFLKKNKDGTYRGGCSQNGYCEMPFNVRRVGFRNYTLDKDSFPVCHNCQAFLADKDGMEKCCAKQDLYIF